MRKKSMFILPIILLISSIFIGCNNKKVSVAPLSVGERFTFTKNGKDQYWVRIDSAKIEEGYLKLKYSYGNIDFTNKILFIEGDNFKIKDNNNYILACNNTYWQEPKDLNPQENCTVETAFNINDKNLKSLTITLTSNILKETATWEITL